MPIPSSPLPEPSKQEAAISAALIAEIVRQIRANGGRIGFADFMALALYAPGLGYYSSSREQFGERGDFVTAPTLGSLFGQCLAQALAPMAHARDVLEFGGGNGALAADLLEHWNIQGVLPRSYAILELSAALRARQAETIRARVPTLFDRVRWLDALPATGFRGVMFGNEVLDAMPVERFVVRDSGIRLIGVAERAGMLAWTEYDAPPAIAERVAGLRLPVGYTSELNLAAQAWMRSVAERLSEGLLLLIDYGFPQAEFYHPDRVGGTLVCHYRQRVLDDPLLRVGLQDITAHVDFSAIAAAGHSAGLELVGYTSQASFLLGSGLGEILARSDPQNVRAHLALTQQTKKLTLPHEMGELYKVIGFARGSVPQLPGFAFQDRRARL